MSDANRDLGATQLRAELDGCSFEHDRLWIVHTPEGSFGLTDYNWEITGYHPRLAEMSEHIRYSGNAYYVVTTLAPQKGWRVEAAPRA